MGEERGERRRGVEGKIGERKEEKEGAGERGRGGEVRGGWKKEGEREWEEGKG